MIFKKRLKPFTAVALFGLGASSLAAGCSAAKNLQSEACCSGFAVGTTMTTASFPSVDASIQGSFVAFANAASDLSGVASGSVSDVTTACQNIALDMGGDPTDPSVAGKTGTDALTGWCAMAKAQIKGSFGASGSLATSVSVEFDPPVCTASISATADCQASCNVNAMCDIKANPPTCTGGTLTVECSGNCTASGSADVACTGNCTGGCSGSCKASGGAMIDCKGKCDGNCTAGAMGGATAKGTGIQADGSCDGQCDGTCTLSADAPKITCTGVCDGHCDAACKGTADLQVKCDGMCDSDYTPLKCEGGKLEGGCSADASCQGSCNASASAKADCTPPSVSVVATANANLDANAQLQLQTAIASLEANLPKILVVFKARGTDFTGSLSAAVDAGATITSSGNLGVSGTACGIIIAAAIGDASTNFAAALSAAGDVAGSVSIK